MADVGGQATVPSIRRASPPGVRRFARPGETGAMERVSVVGCSGAGKTTLGRRLAGILDVPFVELDGLVHQPGWTSCPRTSSAAEVRRSCAGDRWVVDGNYHSMVQDLVWDRADTVVWLDLPRWRVTGRVVSRTLRRVVTRQELWKGNREQLRTSQPRPR